MEGTVPETLTINGQQYSAEDATQFLELGKKYKDLESKLNTSLDKVYPEYTKATQRNKELETELATTRKQMEEFNRKPPVETPADVRQVREAARKAGLVDEDYLNQAQYIKKSELDEYFNQKQTQQKLVDNILTKSGDLEKTIDGSDGRVPYDSEAVLAYASAYNIDNLEDAYDKMNTKGNAKWKEAQIAKEQKPGLTTLGQGGVKQPVQPKVTDNNIKEMWNEMFPEG